MNSSHFDSAIGATWNLGSQTCEFKKANSARRRPTRFFSGRPAGSDVFVNVLVCDTIFDGQERYDTAFFDFDKNLSNGFIARMRVGEWAPFASAADAFPPIRSFRTLPEA